MTYGVYQVTGQREYRGHKTGSTFTASLERRAELRAILRGDIVLLRHETPEVPPDHTFPHGWLPSPTTHTNRGAERRLTR